MMRARGEPGGDGAGAATVLAAELEERTEGSDGGDVLHAVVDGLGVVAGVVGRALGLGPVRLLAALELDVARLGVRVVLVEEDGGGGLEKVKMKFYIMIKSMINQLTDMLRSISDVSASWFFLFRIGSSLSKVYPRRRRCGHDGIMYL